MRKNLNVFLVMSLLIFLIGCSPKEPAVEYTEESTVVESIEEITKEIETEIVEETKKSYPKIDWSLVKAYNAEFETYSYEAIEGKNNFISYIIDLGQIVEEDIPGIEAFVKGKEKSPYVEFVDNRFYIVNLIVNTMDDIKKEDISIKIKNGEEVFDINEVSEISEEAIGESDTIFKINDTYYCIYNNNIQTGYGAESSLEEETTELFDYYIFEIIRINTDKHYKDDGTPLDENIEFNVVDRNREPIIKNIKLEEIPQGFGEYIAIRNKTLEVGVKYKENKGQDSSEGYDGKEILKQVRENGLTLEYNSDSGEVKKIVLFK